RLRGADARRRLTRGSLPPMFPALRSRNFRLLWFGSAAGHVGWGGGSGPMGWLIYDLTSSASWLGRIGFAQSLPTLCLGLIRGALLEAAPQPPPRYALRARAG